MGEIVGAALLGHVPTLMLAEDVRRRLGGGRDTTLVAGLARARERLDICGADTLLVVDTHWFTTTEHIVSGIARHQGTYTSEELPKVIRGVDYDYPGAPELAKRIEAVGRANGDRVLNADDPHLGQHYPTLNLMTYLHRGERVLSTGVCQTAEADDFLAFGAAIAAAVADGDERVAILAAGGLSHRFWPLRQILDHAGYEPEHVVTPEARAADEAVIASLLRGDHAAVIDGYGDYRALAPEGFFGHYLTMAGALGGRRWATPGEQLSDYESSYGTGQVHIWFDPTQGATS